MGFISADDILGTPDRKHVDVEVPEWGGTVRLMELSGDDADAFGGYAQAQRNPDGSQNIKGIRAKLVGLSMVDEKGKRLFSDDAAERKLGKKSGAVLGRLFEEALKLNGMSQDAQDALLENFGDGQSEPSTSA